MVWGPEMSEIKVLAGLYTLRSLQGGVLRFLVSVSISATASLQSLHLCLPRALVREQSSHKDTFREQLVSSRMILSQSI